LVFKTAEEVNHEWHRCWISCWFAPGIRGFHVPVARVHHVGVDKMSKIPKIAVFCVFFCLFLGIAGAKMTILGPKSTVNGTPRASLDTTAPTTTITNPTIYRSNSVPQLMPGQDFTTFTGGISGCYTKTVNTIYTWNNWNEFKHAFVPADGYIYEIRAGTDKHTLGASFELQFAHGAFGSDWQIHISEMSGYVQSFDGTTQYHDCIPQKEPGHLYDIKVQMWNSNYSFHLWIDGVNCGMLAYYYTPPATPDTIDTLELTSNYYVNATFSNLGGTQFVTGSTLFELDSWDDTAVASTSYKIWDNSTNVELATWQAYTDPFTLGSSTNGTYTICYDSVDTLANNETLRYLTACIDTTTPVTSLAYIRNLDGIDASTVFTLNMIETGSGLNHTYINIDGGAWLVYNGSFQLSTAGQVQHVLGYYSEDNVGNVETPKYTTLQPNILPAYSKQIAIRYFSSLDGFGVDWNDVITYINNSYVASNNITIHGSPIFQLLVMNAFNITVLNTTLNASVTGANLRILLPMTTLVVHNNFSFGVLFHYAFNNMSTNTSFPMAGGDSFNLRVALGTYYWWVTDENDSIITWNGSAVCDVKVVLGPCSITFGYHPNGNVIMPNPFLQLFESFLGLGIGFGTLWGIVKIAQMYHKPKRAAPRGRSI
jgi:hypothetical protein